jgi:hypothetical protein
MGSNLRITRQEFLHIVLLLFVLCSICTLTLRAQPQDAQNTDQQQTNAVQNRRLVTPQLNAEPSSTDDPTVSANTPAAAPAQDAPAQDAQEKKDESRNTFQVYGFVMLDSGYDFKTNDPDWFDVVRPTKLPAFAGEFAPNGNVYYGVRQTRFGVKSSTKTRLGDLKTIFEFELFGTGVDAGQTTFRLRQAWGELGQFGAGQTWSTFMDPNVFPNSLEYWGPNGMVFFRNVQFRWTPFHRNKNLFMIALERPGASADQGIYAGRVELQGVTPHFNAPDVSAQGHFEGSKGYLQIAGIVRKISWVDLNKTPTRNLSDTVWGWGVNVSSNLKVGESNTLKLQVVYGKGIENYMNDAPVDIGIQSNLSNPNKPVLGVPLPILGVVSFLDHNWSKKFSTSAGYSLVNVWNSNAQLPSDYHQGHYALTNLLYYPWENVMMGGEFQFGRRLNFTDGFNVNDYRLQFSFKYSFSKGFSF